MARSTQWSKCLIWSHMSLASFTVRTQAWHWLHWQTTAVLMYTSCMNEFLLHSCLQGRYSSRGCYCAHCYCVTVFVYHTVAQLYKASQVCITIDCKRLCHLTLSCWHIAPNLQLPETSVYGYFVYGYFVWTQAADMSPPLICRYLMEFASEALAEYPGLGLEIWSRPSQAWITVRLSTRCVGLGFRYASIHAV